MKVNETKKDDTVFFALEYHQSKIDNKDWVNNVYKSLSPYEFSRDDTLDTTIKYIIPVNRSYDIKGKEKLLALEAARDYIFQRQYDQIMELTDTFGKMTYSLTLGYYKDGKFYFNKKYEKEMKPEKGKRYGDVETQNIYIYKDGYYQLIIKFDENLSLEEFYNLLMELGNVDDMYFVELKVKNKENGEWVKINSVIKIKAIDKELTYEWLTNSPSDYKFAKVSHYSSFQAANE